MIEPPLSLYVHLPWCVRKCPYCDFNSHTAGDAPPKARYIEALLLDLEREATRAAGRTITTVFLGGGTPSLFTPQEIGRLLDGIEDRFDLAGDIEITLETNPGTVDCGAPAGYREAGVNRLSIGAQSFDDARLQSLGRIHSASDILSAVEAARSAGFDNINIDLMHALPGQDVSAALADLEQAVELQPEHISWYQLTLEPNTVFHARPPANLPDDDLAFDIQQAGQHYLDSQGYLQYEVSAYARPGRECRHNLNYWTFGDYLATGAGAHGKVTTADGIYRYRKPANPLQYMKTMEVGGTAAREAIAEHDRLFEFLLNALRLNDGFDETQLEARTGIVAAELAECRSGRGRKRPSRALPVRPLETDRARPTLSQRHARRISLCTGLSDVLYFQRNSVPNSLCTS